MRTTKILLFITLSLSAFSQCSLVYNPFTNQFNCGGASGTVGGASNLTTVGAIPYVSASGVLNQDPTALFWDAANNRLGIGTATPSYALHVAGNIYTNATFRAEAPDSFFGDISTGAFIDIGSLTDASGVWLDARSIGSNSSMNFRTKGTGTFIWHNAGSESMRLRSTGNLLIGTTTDSNFKLDVAASGSAGTARFYGGAGVSNSTKVVVQAGGGQSGNLMEWQNSIGGVLANVRSDGYVFTNGVADLSESSYGLVSSSAAGYVRGLNLTNNSSIGFQSGGFWYSGLDTGIKRNAAGVLEINNGTAGTYRDLQLRALNPSSGNVLIGTTTDGNFKLDIASSGSSGTLRVYDQTATTGVTRAVIRAGAGQSTTNLTEWQDSAGNILARVGSPGDAYVRSVVGVGDSAFGLIQVTASTAIQGLNLGTGSLVTFGASQWYATKDLSLSRASAGVLQVGNGGSNANGAVSLTRSQHAGVLVAALPAAAAGNAGSIQYVTDANATTIGSTVVGGGANKVMVWSDGAAWKIFAN